MKITQTNYYQINKNQNITSSKGYVNVPAFKMGVNKPLQALDGVEKTVQQTGMWTKIKTFLTGSFLAGFFGLSMKDRTDKPNGINTQNAVNNGKIQSEKIFEIEEFLDNSMLLEEFFKVNPNIDINSRNKNGDTIVLKAIRENNYNIIDNLQKQEKEGLISGIDWNAVDSEGKNGLMIAIEQINTREIEYLNHDGFRKYDYLSTAGKLQRDKNEAYKIKTLLELGVNPNYINDKTKFQNFYCTPLQELIIVSNKAAVDAMLESPKTDVNLSHPDTPPPLFMVDETLPDHLSIFWKLANHPSCDLNKKYKEKHIYEHLSSHNNIFFTKEKMIKIVQSLMTKQACDNLQNYYQISGELNLDQIYEYLQLPQLNDVIDKPLNDLNQNIAHFAAGVHVDGYEQLRKMNRIIQEIYRHNRYILVEEDALGRTSLDIACEAENYNFIKLIFSTVDNYDLRFFLLDLQKSLRKLPKEQLNEILPFVEEIYKKNNMSFYM